jgi:multisubunit Na+/H+ antiporter MnhE subunit
VTFIASATAWLTGQEWFRKLVVVLGLVLAVLLALAGFRRRSEKAGRLIEREHAREEIKKAEVRMDKVERATVDELDDRLRDGTF